MGANGDLALAERIGEAGGKMIREYLAELRRQGRIKGPLTVIVRAGRKEIRFPYPES